VKRDRKKTIERARKSERVQESVMILSSLFVPCLSVFVKKKGRGRARQSERERERAKEGERVRESMYYQFLCN